MSTMSDNSLARIPDNISILSLPNSENLSQRSQIRGLNYFTQGYIHQIQISELKNANVCVEAKCWKSLKKRETPHKLQTEISSETGSVVESLCSCKAGLSGHCAHVVGLIKSLQGFKLHDFSHVPDIQSCTSIPQQWHIPRGNKIKPVPINHVVVAKPCESRKRKPLVCHFDVNYRVPEVTTEDLSHLKSLTGTPLAHLSTNYPIVHTPIGDVPLGSLLSYQTRNLKTTPPAPEQKCGNLQFTGEAAVKLLPKFQHLNTGKEFDASALETETRAQSDSREWFNARENRLTASNFGKVLKRKSPPTLSFVGSIFLKSNCTAAPLEYGRRNEVHAKEKYLDKFPQRHIHQCGFVVNPAFDFLGATPDGKVCEDGKSGIIEVKCPYRARDLTISEACEKFGDFLLSNDTGNTHKLKKSHEHFAQVQGQLMITGSPFCDFIVYTKNDLHVERILPDIIFMQEALAKLSTFYQNHAIPFIKNRQLVVNGHDYL